jgi:hypothetical protein
MRVALERPKRPPWLCEEHHVFNGRGLRAQSEKYNCVVYISPDFHRLIHENATVRKDLKAKYQEMLEAAGWTREEFRETFGKSYL